MRKNEKLKIASIGIFVGIFLYFVISIIKYFMK